MGSWEVRLHLGQRPGVLSIELALGNPRLAGRPPEARRAGPAGGSPVPQPQGSHAPPHRRHWGLPAQRLQPVAPFCLRGVLAGNKGRVRRAPHLASHQQSQPRTAAPDTPATGAADVHFRLWGPRTPRLSPGGGAGGCFPCTRHAVLSVFSSRSCLNSRSPTGGRPRPAHGGCSVTSRALDGWMMRARLLSAAPPTQVSRATRGSLLLRHQHHPHPPLFSFLTCHS